ncbi:uncharacterized protein LOC108682991 [Hyalella azteca]|uniref:Uncharacterized protein LOC108682991 n=1 Tax=Hyalella azteca TaxID=294128 RepID=A0A8B7PR82_HYAAZ|nr:uncharacterized protein LOC108682991 [Hyalella azteca]
MKGSTFLVCVGILTLAVQISAELSSLTCYRCAGFLEDRPENSTVNNKNCDLDAFKKEGVEHHTNSTDDPSMVLACLTIGVYDSNHNNGRPFTFRDVIMYKDERRGMKNEELLAIAANFLEEGDVAADAIVDPEKRSYLFVEVCYKELCNGAACNALPKLVALVLPALMLRYLI